MGFIPRPSISLSTLFKYGVAGTAVLLFCTASACICLALLRIVSPNEVDNFISASSTTIMNNVTDFSGLPISIQRKIITLAEYMEADPQTMKRVLSTLPQEVQQVSKYHIPSSLFSGFPLSGLSMIKPILSVLLPTSIVLGVGNYILTNFTEYTTTSSVRKKVFWPTDWENADRNDENNWVDPDEAYDLLYKYIDSRPDHATFQSLVNLFHRNKNAGAFTYQQNANLKALIESVSN